MADTLNDIMAGKSFKATSPSSSTDEDNAERVKLDVNGVFIGTLNKRFEFESKYNKGKMVEGYEMTKLDGSPAVVISKGNLKWNMGPVKEGQLVRITRLPDDTLENGMTSSSWLVETAE